MQTLSKIASPKLSAPLERKRLFKLLDSARKKPTVWLSAPAGSGKTTLVASWLDVGAGFKPAPTIWYSVDAGDADIASFFYYMGLAAKKAAPRHKKPLPLLTPEYLLGIPTFTRRYFENLFSRLTPPRSPSLLKRGMGGVIVLDNYQDAPGAAFHEMIAHALDIIPEGINVIVISRGEPPAQLSRLLANNKIARIGWDKIKFNFQETKAFVKTVGAYGRAPLQKHAPLLHKQTDGWIAGMVLMMEDSGRGGFETRPYTTNRETIFNYFANEIFSKTDKTTQDFLLKTAFLPDMTAEMAQRLTGIAYADKILSGLNRNNYFTQRQAGQNPTYRYHPLFQSFLLDRAETAFNEEKLSKIRQDAATLLAESGQPEHAAKLLKDAEDFEGLTKLILTNAQALAAEGRSKTLEAWITGIPQDILDKTPWLLYWRGVCRIPFAPNRAKMDMEKAYCLFHELNDQAGVFLSWAGVIDSIFNASEDLSLLDPWINSLDDILKENRSFPSLEIEFRVTVLMFEAMIFRRLRHPDITMIWKERAFSVLSRCGDNVIRIQLLAALSLYHLYIGDFATARKLVNGLQGLSELKEMPPVLTIWTKATEATYGVMTASFNQCLKAAAEGIRIADATGSHIWDSYLLEDSIAVALTTGDLITANNMLTKAESFPEKLRGMDRAYLEYLKAWKALICKDISGCHDYYSELRQTFKNLGLNFGEALVEQMLAQLSHERGDEKTASEHLAKLIKLAGEMDSRYLEFLAYMIEAQISFDRGKNRNGFAALKRGMAIGKKQGFMNFHGWRSDVMAMLCAKALEHGIETEYVRGLIRKRNLLPPADVGAYCNTSLQEWPYPIKIYTLGKFEIIKDGKPLEFSGKVQKKPLELLKELIALGGRDVPEEKIADKLWPDAEGDKAHSSFEMTMSRLRKLIGREAIEIKGGVVSLNPRMVWVDVLAKKRP